MQINAVPKVPLCERCGGTIPDVPWGYDHKEVCEYVYWKTKVMEGIKYVNLQNAHTPSWELAAILDDLEIPHKLFRIRGPAGSCLEVFGPIKVQSIIQLFEGNNGYAGMDLREFLARMWTDESETQD